MIMLLVFILLVKMFHKVSNYLMLCYIKSLEMGRHIYPTVNINLVIETETIFL